MKEEVLLERFPYRYVECGTLEINGMLQTIAFRRRIIILRGTVTCIFLTIRCNF